MKPNDNILATIAAINAHGVDQLGRSLNDPNAIRRNISGPVNDAATADETVAVEGAVRAALDELKGVWTAEFQKINDRIDAEMKSRGTADPLDVEQLNAINSRMDQLEGKGNRLVTERKGKARADSALEKEIERAERLGLAPSSDEAKAAFWEMARHGLGGMDNEAKSLLMGVNTRDERKALTVGNQSTTGFLAPSELVMEIIKGVKDFSPIRELARVRPTSSKSSQHPKRTGTFSAVWESENSTTTESTGLSYGMEEIANYKLRALVVVSQEDLEDSAFDLEGEIRTEAAEQFGIAEGTGFATGSGSGQPEGLWTNGDIGSVNSGAATAVTEQGMIDLYFELHEAYWAEAVWLLRRLTLKTVRSFKDGNGQYQWQAGLQGTATPPTILGNAYRICADAPAQGANTYPVMFGAYRKGYVISDRVAMSMKRDEYSNGAAEDDNVNFWFRKRVGGQVVLAEAIKKLKCAA